MERLQRDCRIQGGFMGPGFLQWMITFGETEGERLGRKNCQIEHQVCCRRSQKHVRQKDGTDHLTEVLKATFKRVATET